MTYRRNNNWRMSPSRTLVKQMQQNREQLRQIQLENESVYAEMEEQLELHEKFQTEAEATIDELKKKLTKAIQNNQNLVPVSKISDQHGLFLSYDSQNSFSPQEQKELILSCLKEYSKSIPEDSRRKHLIDNILENNPSSGSLKKTEEELRRLAPHISDMDKATLRQFAELGFDITSDGKHHKMIYHGDERYMFSVPKTASDSRAGKNLICEMINTLL